MDQENESFFSENLGRMTKMAAVPMYGKNSSKIFFSRIRGVDCNERRYVAFGLL